tara:strand:- start:1275 stop:2444 length:1170 start_codon:yes stop_codon:yes gene_type:complete
MIPWTGIETAPTGEYRPCCLYRNWVTDENGKPYTTVNNTIQEVMNSKFMNDLRKEFQDGKRPAGCMDCWKQEDAGNDSKRTHMWTKASAVGQVHLTKDMVSPVFIDFKLGNICNLKCRICWAGSSSQWATENIKTDPGSEQQWRRLLKEGAWPRKKNKFFSSLEDALPHVRFFEITGGEPLMIKEQFDVLRKCVEQGYAKNIDVHYNTNGTQFPEKELNEIWPHFKRIELAYSIDDVGARFEYQRHPAKWDEVNENILKFKNSGLKNLSTQVCTTMNLFNIAYLDELVPYIDEWQPDFWYMNTLHQPTEFDIQQLPKDIKSFISKKLKQAKTRKEEMNTAIQYLNSEPNKYIKDYKNAIAEKIRTIDIAREENFKKVFPLLNKMLEIYE